MSPRSYITSTSKPTTHPINKILPSKKLIEGKREEELTKWNRLRTGIGSEEATRRGGAAPSSCEEDGVEGKPLYLGKKEGSEQKTLREPMDGTVGVRAGCALSSPSWPSPFPRGPRPLTKSHITFTFVCFKKKKKRKKNYICALLNVNVWLKNKMHRYQLD